MTEKQETGMAIITAVIIILLLFLTSCTTKKTVTEYIRIHDTVEIFRTDTLRDIRVVTQRDSTHHETERIITLMTGDSGRVDTVKEVINNTLIRYFEKTDSIDRYRAIADSLRKVLDKEKNKEVVKRIPNFKNVIILLAFVIVILGIIWKVK